MIKLMKNDLYRARKDKSLLIVVIVLLAYALIMALINNKLTEMANLPTIYGKDLFKGTYTLVSDFGLILPIFIASFAAKDFRYHTIKNKIAMGYKKWQVYLSGLLTSFIVGSIIIVFISLFSLGFGCAINGYGPSASFGKEFAFIIVYILLSLIYLFVTISIVYLVTVLTGSTGLAITTSLVLSFIFALLVVIPTMTQTSDVFKNIMGLTNYSQSYSLSTKSLVQDLVVKEQGIGINLLVRSIVITPLVLCGINALGITFFNKKEIK